MTIKNKQSGFTLVEVMVAVAIIGIALPSLLIVMMGHIDGSAYLQDKLQAQWVAENKLTEVRLANQQSGEIPDEEETGTEELAGRKWQWQMRVKAFEQEEFADIYGVEVAVWYEKDKIKDDPSLINLVAIMQKRNAQAIQRPAAEKPSTEEEQNNNDKPKKDNGSGKRQ